MRSLSAPARCGALAACCVALLALAVLPRQTVAGGVVDWVIDLDPAAAGVALPTALLGHYDLSGELLHYDQEPGLASAMAAVGFSDWRVGVGRWEASTQLLPALTNPTNTCAIPLPEQAAPYADDLALIASRDWFSDDGSPVSLADTADDSRYQLAYLRSVLDVVDAFGATPFVSIDSMPFALAFNQTPLRLDCQWSFQNQITNARPANASVFAAAAAGLVERIVEGRGAEPARDVRYWEVWNEPEFPQFWEPAFEGPGPLDRYFEMAINTLFALDAYRAASTHPNAAGLRFGLGSFATAGVAATALASFEANPLPGGFVPLDFMSFHAYSNDPLVVVQAIETVADAAAATTQYANAELALAEWGPNLGTSAGDAVYAASIQPALHIATVLSLGAAAGLDRAHRAIFWDFFPASVQLGLLDHAMNPRSAYRAYELLSRVIVEGAVRVAPQGLADGRLDAGQGAVLVGRDLDGTTRVLLVNRNTSARTANVRFGGATATPVRILQYADPAQPIAQLPVSGSEIVVPAESLVLAEFGPAEVPTLSPSAMLVLCGGLVVGGAAVTRGRAGR